jgi:hypothetical protein
MEWAAGQPYYDTSPGGRRKFSIGGGVNAEFGLTQRLPAQKTGGLYKTDEQHCRMVL